MAESAEVTINVEQLRQNFSAADERGWTFDDVMEWLRECGFHYAGRTWRAEELSLDALDRSEYRVVGRE